MSKSAGHGLRTDISLRIADGDARQNRRQPGSTPGAALHISNASLEARAGKTKNGGSGDE